ncbi:MAG: thioether cross-link-forming SCIFF peptide maturase, partial [Catonella sp.]
MIHQFQSNGYNIVLDVNSGSVHVVDEAAYDCITLYNERIIEKKESEETALPLIKKII